MPPAFEGPSNLVQSMAVTDAGQVRFVSTGALVEWTPATAATTKRPLPLEALYQTASKAAPQLILGKEGELSLPAMAAPAKCLAKADCKVNAGAAGVDAAFELAGDGQKVLFSACEMAVYPALCALSVFDFASGAVVAKLFSPGWVGDVARHLSPKGDYLVLVGIGRTEMVSLATERRVFSATYTINDFPRYRFLDDKTVLFSAAGKLEVADLSAGKVVRTEVAQEGATLELAPDGRRVLLQRSPAPQYSVWNALTGATTKAIKVPPQCADCKAEWTSERHVRFSGMGAAHPDLLFDVVAKTHTETAPPDETVFSSEGFIVTRNLWDGSLHVTTPGGKRTPLEATHDTPTFAVVGGRLFAQCWAWAQIIEADAVAHSFPRTVFQAH